MEEYQNLGTANHKRIAWNKGKLIGPKPPLSPKHVWSIRTKRPSLSTDHAMTISNWRLAASPPSSRQSIEMCQVVSMK